MKLARRLSLLTLSLTLCLLNARDAEAQSQIYIKAGEAKVKKSLIALPQFNLLSTPGVAAGSNKVAKDIYDTVLYDLSVSSYFDFIKPEAFLEDTSKVGLRPGEAGGFNFSSWKQIGSEFLIRAGYKVIGNELTFETYLYYVPQAKLVFAKAYKGKVADARLVAHTYANDVVRELTGKKGIFTTKFAVTRTAGKDQREIFVMDWDGGNQKQISFHKSIANSAAWSPDGRYISYRAFAYHPALKARNADLFTFDLKSGRRWLVSYRKGINSGASYFPDGKNLLLTLSTNGNPDIYKMATDGDGKSLSRITNGPRGAMNVEPSVSPDGSKIAFSSDRSGKPMVYVMNVDGSNVNRLTFAGEYNSTPRWSPDGKKIVFAGYDKGHFDLFVMESNGEKMIRLTSAQKPNGKFADNEEPSFSPDGRHIMFVSNRTGSNQVYIVDADGENERRITFDKHEYFRPTWSPYLD